MAALLQPGAHYFNKLISFVESKIPTATQIPTAHMQDKGTGRRERYRKKYKYPVMRCEAILHHSSPSHDTKVIHTHNPASSDPRPNSKSRQNKSYIISNIVDEMKNGIEKRRSTENTENTENQTSHPIPSHPTPSHPIPTHCNWDRKCL